jgi:hypothetical protein
MAASRETEAAVLNHDHRIMKPSHATKSMEGVYIRRQESQVKNDPPEGLGFIQK